MLSQINVRSTIFDNSGVLHPTAHCRGCQVRHSRVQLRDWLWVGLCTARLRVGPIALLGQMTTHSL
jgi:hypothetical protein